MPCCASGGAPAVHAASCCRPPAAAPSSQPAQGVTPEAAVPAVVSAPLHLSPRPAPVPRTPELPPAPPPLHEGIGLYTLNATFLI